MICGAERPVAGFFASSSVRFPILPYDQVSARWRFDGGGSGGFLEGGCGSSREGPAVTVAVIADVQRVCLCLFAVLPDEAIR